MLSYIFPIVKQYRPVLDNSTSNSTDFQNEYGNSWLIFITVFQQLELPTVTNVSIVSIMKTGIVPLLSFFQITSMSTWISSFFIDLKSVTPITFWTLMKNGDGSGVPF